MCMEISPKSLNSDKLVLGEMKGGEGEKIPEGRSIENICIWGAERDGG